MRTKYKHYLLILIIVSAFVILALTAVMVKTSSPHGVFTKFVLDPIPSSVSDIKVDKPWELSGHRYVMHFKISKTDLELILNSKPFKEMMDIEYKNGRLRWHESPSHAESLGLYRPYDGQPGPVWFRPDKYDDPRVYTLVERSLRNRDHMQVLIYDENVPEAYFVEYQEGY